MRGAFWNKFMELTPEQKLEIELEESYRFAVREHLETSGVKLELGMKLWKILNSPFLLFLLSSVLLAGITKGAASYFSSLEQERAQDVIAKMLYADATYRIARLDVLVQNLLLKYNDLSKIESKRTGNDVIDIYEGLSRVDTEAIFTDFDDRNLRSILWQLLTLEEVSDSDELSRAFQASLQLRSHFENKWDKLMRQDESIGWVFMDPVAEPQSIQINLKILDEEILPALRWITQTKAPFNPNKALQPTAESGG